MSSLSGDEGSEIIENEPVRRTRSGRTLKTNAAVTPKRTPAKKAPARLTRSMRNVQEAEQPPAPVETETNTPENGVQQEVTKDEQDSNSANFDSNESEEQLVEQNQEQILENQEEENNEPEQGEGQIEQGEENSQQEYIVQQEEYEVEQEQIDENQSEEYIYQQEHENLNQQDQDNLDQEEHDYQNEEAQNFENQQDQEYDNQEEQDIQNQLGQNDENQEEPDSESLDQSLQNQEQDVQNQEEQDNEQESESQLEQANELQETEENVVPMESEELVEFEPAEVTEAQEEIPTETQEEIPTETQEEIPTTEPMAVDEVSHSAETTLRVKDASEMMEESIDDQCILIEDDVDQFGLEEELLESTKKDSGTVEKNYSAQDSEIIPDNDQFRNEDVEFILDGNDVSENFPQQANQDDSHEVIEISDHESEPPSKKNEIDTEAVSEDELPTEAAAKEPETEAVSDEELPVTQPADLGETESVSDEELPIESEKKRKSSKGSKSSEKKSKSETSNKRKRNAEGEYDPSSPTSENNDETPAKKVAVSADATSDKTDAKPPSPKKKTLPELEKYWKAVNDDPSDFTGWTYLLQYVDQENDAEAAREAYDKFLERYPYCYGYWRKYADYEKKKGKPERVQTVFDQGLKSISLSVDLWLHYINHCKVVHEKNEEKMREQYERAIKACGLEFRSDRLWESYIKWESENKRLNKVMGIYDRLLSTPTLGYMSHFETFQDFVTTNSPNRILNVDDFLALRAEVKASLKTDDGTTDADDTPPGEDTSKDTPTTDEETRAIREKIISTRRKMHKMNVNAVAARWTFEEGIKRPYFHVKPLERCQLKNWKEYLDYEIEQKDQSRIIVLFERCLIACALYDEFWMRYVRYLESLKEDNTDEIRDVYTRACMVHHPKKPNLHLLWATFEESMGNFDKAASILENIDKATPNMLQIAYRRINLERRRGDLEKSCTLYEHYINTSKNRTIANNIVVKYARFLCKIKNDTDKAVKVLLKATEKDKDNPRLYLQLIDLGLQRNPIDTQEVVKYMDLFIDREHADLEQRVLFAQRKVEFLEDFSTDIRQVLKAHEQFQKCIKQAKERKKTKNEESKAESAKKAKADTSNIPPPAAQSYQYGSTTPYQSQAQFQGGQYSNQGGYQQGYQQYPPPSDPNYANYQNWQYGQSGPQAYAPYNQWGSYNYY